MNREELNWLLQTIDDAESAERFVLAQHDRGRISFQMMADVRKEILPRSCCANTNRSALSASSIVCNNQFSSSLFMTYSFLHNWRFGLFSLDVLNDVPGVTTARDEFRAFSG